MFMTRKKIQNQLAEKLSAIYPTSEAIAIAKVCMMHAGNFDALQYHLNIDTNPTKSEVSAIESMEKRLLKNEPIQYITGHTWFYGLKFLVNPSVLIPRQETEMLVDIVLKENISRKNLHILDIGTGSGCIAISLASNMPEWQITVLDISQSAIDTAKTNANLNKVKLEYFVSNILLETDKLNANYDIIVSNPPYVLQSEADQMHKNITEFEPHKALFVPDSDALLFYDAILHKSLTMLNSGGIIYFEINESKMPEVQSLLANYQFDNIKFYEDFHKKCRFVRALKN